MTEGHSIPTEAPPHSVLYSKLFFSPSGSSSSSTRVDCLHSLAFALLSLSFLLPSFSVVSFTLSQPLVTFPFPLYFSRSLTSMTSFQHPPEGAHSASSAFERPSRKRGLEAMRQSSPPLARVHAFVVSPNTPVRCSFTTGEQTKETSTSSSLTESVPDPHEAHPKKAADPKRATPISALRWTAGGRTTDPMPKSASPDQWLVSFSYQKEGSDFVVTGPPPPTLESQGDVCLCHDVDIGEYVLLKIPDRCRAMNVGDVLEQYVAPHVYPGCLQIYPPGAVSSYWAWDAALDGTSGGGWLPSFKIYRVDKERSGQRIRKVREGIAARINDEFGKIRGFRGTSMGVGDVVSATHESDNRPLFEGIARFWGLILSINKADASLFPSARMYLASDASGMGVLPVTVEVYEDGYETWIVDDGEPAPGLIDDDVE